MHNPRRRILLRTGVATGAAWSLGLAPAASAQNLPDAARILVGFPPGGAPDFIARRLAGQLTGKLAKTVVVDNRPGAGGRIAAGIARQSPPDGGTLLLNPSGVLTINPHSYAKLDYDPFRDFAPVSLAAQIDYGFGIGPAVPANVRTLAEFSAWAKANPGKVSFGSPAAGAPPHFVGDVLNRTLDLGMAHAPYRGAPPALNDLLGGQISALVLAVGDLLPHARAGKLRLLACTGPARSKFAPALPTFAEQNVAGLELRDWFAIYIAGAPAADTMARVVPLVREAASAEAYVQALAGNQLEAAASTPEALDRLARSDLERWRQIVKASGFVADS